MLFIPEQQVGLGGMMALEAGGMKPSAVGGEIPDTRVQNCERIWHLGKMWVNIL